MLNYKSILKKLLRIFAFVVILVLLSFNFIPTPIQAAGTNYYVRKDGNDGNSGLADNASGAKLTIQAALDLATTAGDTVTVHSGTYNETDVWFKGSGSGSDYITLKGYSGETVIIDGTGLTPTNAGVTAYSRHHIWIENLTICNMYDETDVNVVGIYFGVYADGGTGYYVVKDCTIYNTTSSAILVNTSWAYAGGDKISNVIISNVDAYNNCHGGGATSSGEAFSLVAVDTFEIKNCTVRDVQGVDHYTNNKEGIDVKVGCTNGSIHHNEIFNARQGIYVDCYGFNSSGLDIYNNKVHNIESTDIRIGSENGTPTLDDIDIYNNICYNSPNGFVIHDDSAYNGTNIRVINNTFYNHSSREIWLAHASGTNTLVYRNNICYAPSLFVYCLDNDMGSEATIDHNLFYNPDGYDGQTNAFGTDYIQDNPDFVNGSGYNFALLTTSPAKGSGSSTSAPALDYIGTSRPQGLGYDIGAYEIIISGTNTTTTATPPVGTTTTTTSSEYSPAVQGFNGLIIIGFVVIGIFAIIALISKGENIMISIIIAGIIIYLIVSFLPGLNTEIARIMGF